MVRAGTLLLLVLMVPLLSSAAEIRVAGDTLFQLRERSIPGFAKETLAPATQFLRLDVGDLGDGNLSLHLYGWGRVDLADQSWVRKDQAGELTYGYLAYRFPKANGQLKAGRFWVYEGAIAESIDGVSIRSDLGGGFTASVFGGAPVHLDHDDNRGDYIVGGRISSRISGLLELAVSGVHEANTETGSSDNLKDSRDLVGADLWLSPHRMVELVGHATHNVSTGGLADQGYLLLLRPVSYVTISGQYDHQNLQDFFASTNLRSLFNPDAGDDLTSYGGSVSVSIAKPLEMVAGFKHFDREEAGDSDRYGAGVALKFLDAKGRSGLSFYRSDGTAAINSYDQLRAYGLYDGQKIFCSLEGIADLYDEAIYGQDTSYEMTGSLGYRILSSVALSGDIKYANTPWYGEELRGFVRITFNVGHSFGASSVQGGR